MPTKLNEYGRGATTEVSRRSLSASARHVKSAVENGTFCWDFDSAIPKGFSIHLTGEASALRLPDCAYSGVLKSGVARTFLEIERRKAARLQTRLDKLTAAAVADMQHCHPNATSGVSILHSVAEPRHRVGEAEAMAPHMCEVPLWTSTLTAP